MNHERYLCVAKSCVLHLLSLSLSAISAFARSLWMAPLQEPSAGPFGCKLITTCLTWMMLKIDEESFCHILRMLIIIYVQLSWFFSLIYMIHNLSLLPFFGPFSMQIRRALRPFQCISLKLCSWHRWAPVDEVSWWKTISLPNRVGTTLKDVQRWKLQVGCHTIHSLAVGPGWWTVEPTSRDQAVLKNRGRLPSQAEAFFGLGWANGVCAVSACVACPLSMVLICANIIQLICQIHIYIWLYMYIYIKY